MATTLPVLYPLVAPYQGDDYIIRFQLKSTGPPLTNINLTGAIGRAQVRRQQNRDSELILAFSFASTSTDLTNGICIFVADAAVMTAAPFGQFFYDCQVEKSGERRTILRGPFTITPEITVESDYVSP